MRIARHHHLRSKLLERFWQRARGLLMRQDLLDRQGVLIRPCRSIHTLGMTRTIDVVFLDCDYRVTEVHLSLRPCRALASRSRGTLATLELAAGDVDKFGIQAGDRITFL
jgi:uncharacterized protein